MLSRQFWTLPFITNSLTGNSGFVGKVNGMKSELGNTYISKNDLSWVVLLVVSKERMSNSVKKRKRLSHLWPSVLTRKSI